jgi:hypothetical protein
MEKIWHLTETSGHLKRAKQEVYLAAHNIKYRRMSLNLHIFCFSAGILYIEKSHFAVNKLSG